MARSSVSTKRRQQLIDATIATIHQDGFARASLATIGRRASLSPGIVAHYFRDKAGLLDATMRYINKELGDAVLDGLRRAETPAQRVGAILEASFGPEQFSLEMTQVWVTFWSQANESRRLGRIQRIYRRRLESNLRHALKQLAPPEQAAAITAGLGALIDGLALRHALYDSALTRATAHHLARDYVCKELALNPMELDLDARAA